MRHRISGKQLGRTRHQRQALFRNLARAIFIHGSICTTRAKAQATIPLIEKICRLCQKSHQGDLSSRRRIFAIFQDRKFVNRIVKAIAATYTDRQSNFTKTSCVKRRQGDDALIVKLEFTLPVDLKDKIKPTPSGKKNKRPSLLSKKTKKAQIVKKLAKTKTKVNEK